MRWSKTEMTEPHTADLGTRYRYRLEGAQLERERIIEELEANEHIWRERVALVALKALIKGEQN